MPSIAVLDQLKELETFIGKLFKLPGQADRNLWSVFVSIEKYNQDFNEVTVSYLSPSGVVHITPVGLPNFLKLMKESNP